MEATEFKARLRAELRAQEPPPAAVVAAVIDALESWLRRRGPRLVVGFLPMTAEIDMSPLVARLPEIDFALTRTAPEFALTVHPFDAPRELHRLGFEQPAATAAGLDISLVDVVLVPGLGFDRTGARLGRGAGYYDRFLARVDAETVALTTDSRLVDAIPLEPHDVRLRWLATESGVFPTSEWAA